MFLCLFKRTMWEIVDGIQGVPSTLDDTWTLFVEVPWLSGNFHKISRERSRDDNVFHFPPIDRKFVCPLIINFRENRWIDWIFGFLPSASTKNTQITGFQRTFVIFDLSKVSKITHFDLSQGRKTELWSFSIYQMPLTSTKKGQITGLQRFYMTSPISRQSAVGEITYISGIV